LSFVERIVGNFERADVSREEVVRKFVTVVSGACHGERIASEVALFVKRNFQALRDHKRPNIVVENVIVIQVRVDALTEDVGSSHHAAGNSEKFESVFWVF
jgi:hypothetical protein